MSSAKDIPGGGVTVHPIVGSGFGRGRTALEH